MAKRFFVQLASAILHNGNLPGFITGRIWQAQPKSVCLPVLNCYSCPGALGACPIGSLQSTLAGTVLKFPFYVLGLLLLFALCLGRVVCGWLCPFGLVQDLLYKIPTPKLRKNSVTAKLSYLKYFIAVIFVMLLPIYFWLQSGVGVPAFCKYICPAGTLEAGLPLVALNTGLQNSIGLLFGWKFLLMLIILGAGIFIYRPFCRFLCPLGAWYGLFNKLSLFGIKVDTAKCVNCHACANICKMDVKIAGGSECINCGECKKICPTGAISFKTKF